MVTGKKNQGGHSKRVSQQQVLFYSSELPFFLFFWFTFPVAFQNLKKGTFVFHSGNAIGFHSGLQREYTLLIRILS